MAAILVLVSLLSASVHPLPFPGGPSTLLPVGSGMVVGGVVVGGGVVFLGSAVKHRQGWEVGSGGKGGS